MKIGIIGGSGLDDPKFIENFSTKTVFTPYGGCSSELTCGQIGGHDVVILSRHGQNHKIAPSNVPYRANVWAMKQEKCDFIIATTACGSLREEIKPGDLVFPDQFIDFTKKRNNTFFDDQVVHTPMAEPFTFKWKKELLNKTQEMNLRFHEKGTVITIEGPRFSTRAESKYFQTIGADIINMSTASEVILANELKIPYCAIAMATDYDCWKEGEESVSWEMIVARLNENAYKTKNLIIEFIKSLPAAKKIAMVGVGYVGLVTGTCLAEIGNIVTCVDVNEKRIENLKKGISPIFEPGIEELITKNVNAERLFFSNNLKSILNEQDIIFIAVGTPPKENGEADLQYVEAVAHEIGKNIQKNLIIVNKSTVPIGTGDTVTQIIREYYGGEFSVVSNPEFLREGTAIDDFLHADRVVLGCDNHAEAIKIMQELYQPLECPILVTDLKSAEMIKYASNSFLAMSISFINSVANICEKVGADVLKVSEGMRLDKRIGKKAFITAGCGYGGSCFPKDVQALINIGRQNNETFTILEETEKVNEIMKTKIFHKLKKHHPDLVGKKVALWGVAFKPLTDDLRFAPALKIIEKLLAENASISVFDPVAHANLKNIHPQLHYADSPQEAVKDADILLVVTEWKHFKEIKLFEIKELMKGLVIIDGRNIFDPEEARSYGFIYESIGRRPHQNHFYL